MNHTQNTYIASLLGYDGTEDEENEQEQLLSDMTPKQLLDLAAPLVQKINCRIPLTQDEAEQYAAILAEAFKKLAAQRSRDVAERDELMARRNYRRPACEISQDEAASLNTFYSGVEA